MSEHALVTGSGRDLPTRPRRSRAGTRTTAIRRPDRGAARPPRLTGTRPDTPDDGPHTSAGARRARARAVGLGAR